MSSQSFYRLQINFSSKCHDQVYNFPGGSHISEEHAHMCIPYFMFYFILAVYEICHFLSLPR